MKKLRTFRPARSPRATLLELGTVERILSHSFDKSGSLGLRSRVARWYVTLRFGRTSVRLAVSEKTAKWILKKEKAT